MQGLLQTGGGALGGPLGALAGSVAESALGISQSGGQSGTLGAGIMDTLAQPKQQPLSLEGLALLHGLGPVAPMGDPVDIPLPPAKNISPAFAQSKLLGNLPFKLGGLG